MSSSTPTKTTAANEVYRAAYKSGAAAERARWQAILGSSEASTNRAQAIHLAANTGMSYPFGEGRLPAWG